LKNQISLTGGEEGTISVIRYGYRAISSPFISSSLICLPVT